MTAFISHSFRDRPAFENLTGELERMEVPYWDPDRMRPSSSLRDQLHAGLSSCSVCVFIATANSVQSKWCLTELGAFWGQGRPIVVYLADPSLLREQLPEIIRDTLWEERIRPVADEVKRLLAASEELAGGVIPAAGGSNPAQLEDVIVGIVSLLRAGAEANPSGTPPAADQGDEHELRTATRAILHGRDATGHPMSGDSRQRILWVDEHPEGNLYERRAFASAGFAVTMSGSVPDALIQLGRSGFAAVVACLGEREWYYWDLLGKTPSSEQRPPLFIYANLDRSNESKSLARGVAGVTNNPRDLLTMVVKALPR